MLWQREWTGVDFFLWERTRVDGNVKWTRQAKTRKNNHTAHKNLHGLEMLPMSMVEEDQKNFHYDDDDYSYKRS